MGKLPGASQPEETIGALIEAAHGGSQEALGCLLERYRDYLLVIAHAELNVELRAKGGPSDLVQETFLDAQRGFRRFHGHTKEELLRWLREIMENNVVDFGRRYRTASRQIRQERRLDLRRKHDDATANQPLDLYSPEDALIEGEQQQLLRSAIERLAPDHFEVVKLRHIEGRSWSETAAAMNRSVDAVQKLWMRALERLRKELGRQ